MPSSVAGLEASIEIIEPLRNVNRYHHIDFWTQNMGV